MLAAVHRCLCSDSNQVARSSATLHACRSPLEQLSYACLGAQLHPACRTARPLLLGMMWFDPTDAATVHQEAIRHEAQQGDKLSSYGWVRHDGRSYGRQEIADGDFQLTVQMVRAAAAAAADVAATLAAQLSQPCMQDRQAACYDRRRSGCHQICQNCCTTMHVLPHCLYPYLYALPLLARATLLQVKHRSEGSGYGGDWAVRVSVALTAAGRAKQDAAKAAAEAEGRKAAKRKLSLVFYFADAHWRSSELEMWPEQQQSKLGEVGCTGCACVMQQQQHAGGAPGQAAYVEGLLLQSHRWCCSLAANSGSYRHCQETLVCLVHHMLQAQHSTAQHCLPFRSPHLRGLHSTLMKTADTAQRALPLCIPLLSPSLRCLPLVCIPLSCCRECSCCPVTTKTLAPGHCT